MISVLILGTLLAFSSALPKPSTDHIHSQFLTDDELREAAAALENGLSSEDFELVNLQETRNLESTTLSLHSENRQHNLKLTPSTRLIHKNALVRIVDGDKEKYKPFSLRSSLYHGYVDDEDKGSVALAKTNRGWTGLVETKENKYILQGIPDSDKHLLVRMKLEDLFGGEHEEKVTLRKEVFNMSGDESFTRNDNPELKLEVGAYADEELFAHVKNRYPEDDAEQKAEEIILIILNSIHTYYQKPSIGNRITIQVAGLTIMKTDEPGLVKSQVGDVYLDNFCDWDAKYKNPMGANYDIGLLFTGYDMHILSDDVKVPVVGLAYLGETCKFLNRRSCSLSIAKDFSAGLTMAHEIGHNLGMRHDGTTGVNGNACTGNTHIMAPMVGTGITDFSECSKKYLSDYLRELDNSGQNCMRVGGNSAMEHSVEGQLPGQRLEKGEQCHLVLGEGYTDFPAGFNFCKHLLCVNPTTFDARWFYDPPLPGTDCGNGKICYNGECMEPEEAQNIIKSSYSTTVRHA